MNEPREAKSWFDASFSGSKFLTQLTTACHWSGPAYQNYVTPTLTREIVSLQQQENHGQLVKSDFDYYLFLAVKWRTKLRPVENFTLSNLFPSNHPPPPFPGPSPARNNAIKIRWPEAFSPITIGHDYVRLWPYQRARLLLYALSASICSSTHTTISCQNFVPGAADNSQQCCLLVVC
jgi:hypothetical protein